MSEEIIRELLEKKQSYINRFFDRIDHQSLLEVVDAIYQCQGIVVLSGVGKSGLVAKKIALTLTSTGTRALFLSPVDALHGDVGVIRSEDVFILLSKSGETDELLQLLPFMRNRGVKIIGLISERSASLAKAVDLCLYLPLERELCPFDMAPTTSTVIQMIAGDIIAIALMRLKEIKLDEYAKSHPAGAIGRKAGMIATVKELMLTGERVPLCFKSQMVHEILPELTNKRCGCLLIVTENFKLEGIFTDGDLRRALQKAGGEILQWPIAKLITGFPRTIGPDIPVHQAVKIMEGDQKHEVTVLPVVDEEKKVLGLLKLHDLIQSGV